MGFLRVFDKECFLIGLNNKKELEKYKGPIDKNLKVIQKIKTLS